MELVDRDETIVKRKVGIAEELEKQQGRADT